MFCGVDEAGKGAVLGPMVVAGVSLRNLHVLDRLGVLDSKLIPQKKREEIFVTIQDICTCHAVYITPGEIDEWIPRESMNMIVARAHAACITALLPETAFLDACDVNEQRFARTVHNLLRTPCSVVAEHRADLSHSIVGAASIIAKVLRDRAIHDLSLEYGDIGSGYPSDKKTIQFLSEYIAEHENPPPCARASWSTVTGLLSARAQSSLADF
ncbi:MAG: ribonuclease HII [Methanocalculus sp. MSAO_Arc2]|nr:MAG: ribonuclease HII [Methanocalculus sp. MSAO_Arc2]